MSRTVVLVVSGFGSHKPFLMVRHEHDGEMSDGKEIYSSTSDIIILIRRADQKHAEVHMSHDLHKENLVLTEFYAAEIADYTHGKKAFQEKLNSAFSSQGWIMPEKNRTVPDVWEKYQKFMEKFLLKT